ncbi:MAG TPA: DMT family transporter [Verrucomicrobiae bacterium]|jgi:drug/metabolite transporter (DMT)-like permease|nr:DMT family transporter [Verrucomicrobiae bacterium]
MSSAVIAQSHHRTGVILIAAAAVIWSTGGLLGRMVETEPATKLFLRSGFACLALLIYVAIRHRGKVIKAFRDLGWAGIIVACCFATASSCFIFALEYTTVANILFIQAAAPVFAGLLGWVLMREPVGLRTWICMAAVLGGIGIMMLESLEGSGLIGNLLSIVMMMGFSSAIVVTRRHREIRMAPATCLATLIAACVAFPMADPSMLSTQDIGIMALFGAGQMAFGLVMFTAGTRLIPAAEAGLISNLEPVLAPVWVWLAFSEMPSDYTIIGGLLVLCTLVIYTLMDWRQERAVPPAV